MESKGFSLAQDEDTHQSVRQQIDFFFFFFRISDASKSDDYQLNRILHSEIHAWELFHSYEMLWRADKGADDQRSQCRLRSSWV